MNLSELYPDRFVSAEAFAGKTPTLTMHHVVREEVGHGGSKDTVVVLYFAEKSKATGDPIQLVLNRTNATAIAAMFGNDADAWAGHKVTLVSEMVRFGADTMPGVRIKGSPELDAPIAMRANKSRNMAARTLVPTSRTGAAVAPAAAPGPAPSPDPATARCIDCGVTVTVTPDTTPDDVASMRCDECGGVMSL